MDETGHPTRRRFFMTAGAALSAPLAVAQAAGDSSERAARERLAELEACEAVRALERELSRRVVAGDVAGIEALFLDPASASIGADIVELMQDTSGQPDRIIVAPDRLSASGSFNRSLRIRAPLTERSTLIDMAKAQGSAFIEKRERRTLHIDFAVAADGRWRIAELRSEPQRA